MIRPIPSIVVTRHIVWLWLLLPAVAIAGVLEDVVPGANKGSFRLNFNCPVHYIDHRPRAKAERIEIDFLHDGGCGTQTKSTDEQPIISPDAADQVQTVSSHTNIDNAGSISLQFRDPVIYTVTQGEDPHSITVLTIAIPNAIEPPKPVTLPKEVAPATKASSGTLTTSRMSELLTEARERLLDGNYEDAIQIYTRILAEPHSPQHPAALEYLGVAYEKHGLPKQAKDRYQQYLDRFDDGADALRVTQRLQALAETNTHAAVPHTPQAKPRGLAFMGSISQDYWSSREDIDGISETRSTKSLLTYGDFALRHQGNRYRWLTQVNAGYLHDLSQGSQAREDQTLVANAFLDVADDVVGWSARLGRQTLYADGILGRFEGIRGSYQWRDTIGFNLTLGSPVDTLRFAADTNRRFVSLSADLDDLLGVVDLSLFTHFQTDDGIADREAVGGSLAFNRGRWRIFGQLDYDTSFAALNSGLLQADFQLNRRVRLYARANALALPFLMSRNALIGQGFTKTAELETIYSEAQIRTLARHRTADALQLASGFSALLNENWYLNADIHYQDIKRSTASGGVAARPASTLIHSAATFTGSSIFRTGDTAIIGVRVNSTDRADTASLLFELRMPWGNALRIGPKLSVAYQEVGANGAQQWWVEPGMRLTYRLKQRYQLTMDVGSRLSEQTFDDDFLTNPALFDEDERSSELYFNIGWRADF